MKVLTQQPELLGSVQPFGRAALSSRLIGVAGLTLGAVSLYALRETSDSRNGRLAIILFALMFMVPGALYFILATFVARRKRWAIIAGFTLAMFDMTLLGVLFVTSWGTPVAPIMCGVSGLFVVALAGLTTYLGRSLEHLKRGRSSI